MTVIDTGVHRWKQLVSIEKKCYGGILKQCYNEKTCSIKFVLFNISETKERWKESLKQCPCGSL